MREEDINSLDSESGVIATLIHHPDFYFHAEGSLLPNHFTSKENRIVYTAIQMLERKGIERIDAYNIFEILNSSESTRQYANEITIDQINELVDMSDVLARHTPEEYKVLVKNILDASFRRDALVGLKECRDLCLNRSSEGIERQIYDIIDGVMSEYSTTEELPEIGEVADKLWEEIVAHQDGKDTGIPFKFPTLNEYVRLEPCELVVVGAPAKGAKSMFMMNEAVDVLRQGKSVMYIDSELSTRLFMCRMLSHLTGIEFGRIRSGRYNEQEEERIKEQLEWIKQQPLTHVYFPIFDQDTIYTSVKKMMHRYGQLDVLIVDYLKPTGSGDDAYTTYSELGRLVDKIKNQLCGDMGIAGLAAAQLTSNGKLADSAKIARNASTILLLVDKTQEEIDADGIECGNKKIIVSKNRNGMQHVEGEYIDIQFNGNICGLREAKQHVKEEPF